MIRILSRGSSISLVLAALLFGAGLATSWNAADEEIRFDNTVKSIGQVPVGRTFPVTFLITNTTDRPLHILGSRGT